MQGFSFVIFSQRTNQVSKSNKYPQGFQYYQHLFRLMLCILIKTLVASEEVFFTCLFIKINDVLEIMFNFTHQIFWKTFFMKETKGFKLVNILSLLLQFR